MRIKQYFLIFLYHSTQLLKFEQVDISSLLDITLSKLGFNNITKLGFTYYKAAIILSLSIPEDDIILKDIYLLVAEKFNRSPKKIKKNIDNLFNQINIDTFIFNFKSVFKINFEYTYTTPKNLLILLIILLKKLY